MMDKFEKIEEKLNSLLEKILKKLSRFFVRIFHFIILKKVFDKIEIKNKALKEWKTKKKQSLKAGVQTSYKNYLKKQEKFFQKIDSIQKYPFKEKIAEFKIKTRIYLTTTSPKEHIHNIKNIVSPLLIKLKNKLLNINKAQVGMTFVLIFFIALGSYSIYLGSTDIYQHEYPNRGIASTEQAYDYRPEYRQYADRTLKIQNIKVPIYTERLGEIDSITVDFSLRLSTKFSKYYLEEYEYKLKDYFFTTVEPILSGFLINEEGKEVLKEKIIIEIDNFLKENNVEGHVDDVNILYIVGS